MGMDEEVSEVLDTVNPGDKIKITVEVTVSELDSDRLKATIDRIHSDVSVLSEADEYEEEEEFEEDTEEEEEEFEDMDE
tara:strand:+ start:690 stop:926 length:237 start_codon:yes stop_codon:yes gene_type:complete